MALPANTSATAGEGSGGDTPEQLVLGFVPSAEAEKIADTAQPMVDFVSRESAFRSSRSRPRTTWG
jgi:ABC-type phosphate/phosphonate transport system substrate-binding protein